MPVTIKNRWTGEVLLTVEKDALAYADLKGACLTGADLTGADLKGASLTGASLPTGERWETYLSEVVPALLTAGGCTIQNILDASAWQCHSWGNCPMAMAFGVHGFECTPLLLRPRVTEFIMLFDARIIPAPRQLADGTWTCLPEENDTAAAGGAR
jgi:hypothetical protein